MWNTVNEKSNQTLKAYSEGSRKSWLYGVITLPPLMVFYVHSTKLSNEVWTDIMMGVFVITFIGLFSVVAFENRKWRSIPVSVLITMGFGLCIVGSLAKLTVNTPDQVLNSSLLLMSLCGLYGFCSAVLGVMIHRSFKPNKSQPESV